MQLFAAAKMYTVEKLSSCYQELYVELLCTWSCNGKKYFPGDFYVFKHFRNKMGFNFRTIL